MGKVTESQFYMWRTLFALTHADDVITEEEAEFMEQTLRGIPFSATQEATLKEDIKTRQDAAEMFKKISDQTDQAHFFRFAKKLVWADGDFAPEEQALMLKLQEIQVKNTDVDDMAAQSGLEIDEEYEPPETPPATRDSQIKTLVSSFREQFLRGRFGKVAE